MNKEETCAFTGTLLDPKYGGWSKLDEERYQAKCSEGWTIDTSPTLREMQETRDEEKEYIEDVAAREMEDLLQQAAKKAKFLEMGCVDFMDQARWFWKNV